MDFDALSRRHIGLFGALAALPAVPATAQTPRALPTAPRDILNTMVRIGGTSGKNRVTWKTRIIVYAVEPTGVRPLVGLRGSESAWWKKVDDDTFIRYSSTLSFFEDLETGKFIDEFKNPLTGAMNKVGVSFIRHKEGEYYTTKGEYFGTMKKAFPDVYKDEMPAPKWKLDGDVIRIQGDLNFC